MSFKVDTIKDKSQNPNMTPEIVQFNAKGLVGMSQKMSIVDNKTRLLFRSFMPRRKEIKGRVDLNIYDVRIYPSDYYLNFSPAKSFTKWVAVEVEKNTQVPSGMSELEIPFGLYALFHYKGLSDNIAFFQFIFREWLPNSDYELDNRPHFDVLSKKTKLNDPNSEEDIYIPVKPKQD
jgi:AraC family transcriptional regulator